MVQRLMGMENEYGCAGLDSEGSYLPRGSLVDVMLMKLAREGHLNLRDLHHRGMFLTNGGLLYADQGHHAEMCSPECTDPLDLVRYVKAGDRLLQSLAGDLEAAVPGLHEAIFWKGNVDYLGATWGCHESHLTTLDPLRLEPHLVPHLVSRIIYSGAGGFDPLAAGLEFSLSPRTAYLVKVRSDHSTSNRAIFHTKDEPLAGHGYHRMHLICGNGLQSEVGLFLTMATTSLLVCLVEAGLVPGDEVRLRSPLQAMRAFAADPDCKVQVATAGGQRTAIDIQRHYLSQVEDVLGTSLLPAWAEDACRCWREVLDLLEEDARQAAGRLDWRIKYELFSDQVRQQGMDWNKLRVWSEHLGTLRQALIARGVRNRKLTPEKLLGRHSPVRAEVKALTPTLLSTGATWDELEPVLQLRSRLLELDMRFSQLSERGIFNAMDRAGVLQHRLVSDEEIQRAMSYPPAHGRAHLRGKWVREIEGDREQIDCGWDGIWDNNLNRMLDLSDPFETEERWRPMESPGPGNSLPRFLRARRSRLIRDLLGGENSLF